MVLNYQSKKCVCIKKLKEQKKRLKIKLTKGDRRSVLFFIATHINVLLRRHCEKEVKKN